MPEIVKNLSRNAARTLPRWAHVLLALMLPVGIGMMEACDGPGGTDGGVDPDGGSDGFDDHTVPQIASLADFDAMAAEAASSSAVKFVITRFLTARQSIHFMDSNAYALHDEWYWFRLMNGQPFDGVAVAPVDVGRSFATVADIVTWARGRSDLPLDLVFVNDGRLYSPSFYNLALFVEPKQIGIGTVLHFPARPDVEPPLSEHWALELEYQHNPNVAELTQMFAQLDDNLPASLRGQVKLLPRSPIQRAFAAELVSSGSPLAERLLSYADVTVPGESEVYSEGLTAGRLKVVHAGESFDGVRSTDILISEDVPDFLPPCSGLVTAVPQTALAHVNILARNRGIPNAYRGGLLDDPQIDQLARVAAPVIIKASGTDTLQLVAMSEQNFALFRSLSQVPRTAVPPIDLTGVRATYDLTAESFADEATLRPILGGKSAGYLALLDAEGITTPPRPLGISIAPYVEHIETTTGLKARLTGILNDSEFIADARVRFLVLEGETSYLNAHPDGAAFVDAFLTNHATGGLLRDVVDAGGVMGIIMATPIAPATLAAVMDGLTENFGNYADTQGLRFRSSSNVEDAEGFNGAGLYTSNTGFLHAERLVGEPTVEDALRTTWASYWGSEAFEERRLANVDHLSGAMASAVHANFPDSFEMSNGVITFTLLPPGHPDGAASMELNAQVGALSVTNPPPGDPNLPEVDRLYASADGVVKIKRIRASTLSAPGAVVLTETQLRDIFAQVQRVTTLWLDTQNAALPAANRRRTLTLDLEYREVRAGWPAINGGNTWGQRVVIKQARTLEPSLVRVPERVRAMPFPLDVLARATRVEERTCYASSYRINVAEAFTDPLKEPRLGFDRAPFTSVLTLEIIADMPDLGLTAGDRDTVNHLAFSVTHPGMDAGGEWTAGFEFTPAASAALGVDRLEFADGHLIVGNALGTSDEAAACVTNVAYSSPEELLESILRATQ